MASTSQRPRRVTRNDVAKRAGVSPAVVSYVINQSKYVSPEKTEAVKKAIEELQYRPNVQARSLRTNRSMQIAFVCDNLRNDWLEDAEKILFEKGYYVSHCYTRDGDDFINSLIDRQFDAIFMMSNRFTARQLNVIADMHIPLVLYRSRVYEGLDSSVVTVAPDIYEGVRQSVNYLAFKGHEHIALIPPLRYRTEGMESDGFRARAYIDAMKQNGLETDDFYICRNVDSIDDMISDVFGMLISGKKERPTAFITGNDYTAIKIISYIKSLGMRVPEDIAVMGSDNTYIAEMSSPSITTVDFPKEEFCRKLADTLLELMDGKSPADEYIKVSLVVRESA